MGQDFFQTAQSLMVTFFLGVNDPAFWQRMRDLNWQSLVSFFSPGWRSKVRKEY